MLHCKHAMNLCNCPQGDVSLQWPEKDGFLRDTIHERRATKMPRGLWGEISAKFRKFLVVS